MPNGNKSMKLKTAVLHLAFLLFRAIINTYRRKPKSIFLIEQFLIYCSEKKKKITWQYNMSSGVKKILHIIGSKSMPYEQILKDHTNTLYSIPSNLKYIDVSLYILTDFLIWRFFHNFSYYYNILVYLCG